MLRLKQRDRECPSQCFTGPQVAQEWNTTQLVHVRWSGSTAGGTSKRGRVQNSPSGRVEGMEAKRTRGARLRRGILPKNKELNGRQRQELQQISQARRVPPRPPASCCREAGARQQHEMSKKRCLQQDERENGLKKREGRSKAPSTEQ